MLVLEALSKPSSRCCLCKVWATSSAPIGYPLGLKESAYRIVAEFGAGGIATLLIGRL